MVVASKVDSNNIYLDIYCSLSSHPDVPVQNILPGQEVTENYYPLAQVIPRPVRRSWLREHYWWVTS